MKTTHWLVIVAVAVAALWFFFFKNRASVPLCVGGTLPLACQGSGA